MLQFLCWRNTKVLSPRLSERPRKHNMVWPTFSETVSSEYLHYGRNYSTRYQVRCTTTRSYSQYRYLGLELRGLSRTSCVHMFWEWFGNEALHKFENDNLHHNAWVIAIWAKHLSRTSSDIGKGRMITSWDLPIIANYLNQMLLSSIRDSSLIDNSLVVCKLQIEQEMACKQLSHSN